MASVEERLGRIEAYLNQLPTEVLEHSMAQLEAAVVELKAATRYGRTGEEPYQKNINHHKAVLNLKVFSGSKNDE